MSRYYTLKLSSHSQIRKEIDVLTTLFTPCFLLTYENSMPCRMSHASIPAEVRAARAMPEDLIRLCVGIEDVDDLLEDLYHALTASGALKLAN